jgi:hypothetical protein
VIASDRSRRPAWHYWLAAIGVVLVGGYLYLFISAILAPPLPPVTNENSVIMRALQVVGQKGPRLGWSFNAESSETSVDGSFTTYHNVRDGTYFEKGKPAYHLTASEVLLDTRSQSYTATGGVHMWAVTGEQPRDIRADSVTWSQPAQTLSFPTDVTVVYTGSVYKGKNMYIDFRNGSVHSGPAAVSYHKTKK